MVPNQRIGQNPDDSKLYKRAYTIATEKNTIIQLNISITPIGVIP